MPGGHGPTVPAGGPGGALQSWFDRLRHAVDRVRDIADTLRNLVNLIPQPVKDLPVIGQIISLIQTEFNLAADLVDALDEGSAYVLAAAGAIADCQAQVASLTADNNTLKDENAMLRAELLKCQAGVHRTEPKAKLTLTRAAELGGAAALLAWIHAEP